MKPTLFALVALFGTTACSDSLGVFPGREGGPTLRVSTDAIPVGSAIAVDVTNETLDTHSAGTPCNMVVERRTAAGWELAWSGEDLGCIAVVLSVAPGTHYVRTLPGQGREGVYRIRAYWSTSGDTPLTSVSNTFEILDETDVRVEVLIDEVDDGSSLPVRLTNLKGHSWGYNTCSAGRFERLQSGAWVSMGEPMILCTAMLYSLGAHGTADAVAFLPQGFPAGTYRFTQRLWHDERSVVSASESFLVR